jgi:hypothetical protein
MINSSLTYHFCHNPKAFSNKPTVVPGGYRAMNEREAIKVMITP